MIAIAKEKTNDAAPAWHDGFLAMLPTIRRHATIAFRDVDDEASEEAVQEVICNAMRAYVRLFELGKTEVAYPSALARYAVAQVRAGRKVGGNLNIKDVTSEYAQRSKSIRVQRLDRYDQEEQGWREVVVEDRTAGPAEIAACRIDYSDWLKLLTSKQRKIANMLAVGETTKAVAGKVGLTDGRVSQMRRELMEAWEGFVSEAASAV